MGRSGRSFDASALILLVFIVPLILWPGHATAAPYAYIKVTGGITVIDTATDTVTATVQVPGLLALHPAGSSLYAVCCADYVGLTVINTVTNTVAAWSSIQGFYPEEVVVNPAGTVVYVTNFAYGVVVIAPTTNHVVANVPISTSRGVAVHPSGTPVYVANASDHAVSVIDAATDTITANVFVGNPWDVAVHPAGTKAYVTNCTDNTVSVIDTATNTVTATVPVGPCPGGRPAIGPLTPGLSLGLNQTTFHTGQTLTLALTTYQGASPVTADVYVPLQVPLGFVVFLQADGTLASTPSPFARSWPISPVAGYIFAHTFDGGEPAGSWTWRAVFMQPGTLNPIGLTTQAPFSFSP